MAESKSDWFPITMVVILVCTVLGIKVYEISLDLVLVHAVQVVSFIILIVCIISFVVISIILIVEYFDKRSKKSEEFKREIEKIGEVEYLMVKDYNEAIKKLENLALSKLGKKFRELISQTEKKLLSLKSELQKKLQEQRLEAQKEKQRRIRDHKLISKLANYFNSINSSESIPKWALRYRAEIVEQAQEIYNIYIENVRRSEAEEERRIEKEEEQWNEAVKFVLEHHSYPPNFNKLDKATKELYQSAIWLDERGELIGKIDTPEEDQELVGEAFYLAKELDDDKIERLKNYGYRLISSFHLDGTFGNTILIRNDPRNESDYHFCIKHLLRELDQENSFVEYSIDELRADIAFIYPDKKIAVEIETGKNKPKQVKTKVEWLNDHFNYWIIICSRANRKNYKNFIDNKKSFCLTLKQAADKLQELIIN